MGGSYDTNGDHEKNTLVVRKSEETTLVGRPRRM
jgi:hypothetical protein